MSADVDKIDNLYRFIWAVTPDDTQVARNAAAESFIAISGDDLMAFELRS